MDANEVAKKIMQKCHGPNGEFILDDSMPIPNFEKLANGKISSEKFEKDYEKELDDWINN